MVLLSKTFWKRVLGGSPLKNKVNLQGEGRCVCVFFLSPTQMLNVLPFNKCI